MATFSILLNILGLLLDAIGFIGLYYNREKFFSNMSISDLKLIAKHLGSGNENSGKTLVHELITKGESASEVKNKRLKKTFFRCVLFGVICQLMSSVISFAVNISPKSPNDSAQQTGPSYNRCK